jgi:non-ribosomal peptide synthetase component E (peptide arylation enzyme)
MLDHIGQIPAHAARSFRDREALAFEGRSFSFNDLNALIEKLAGGLHSLGIAQGEVVTGANAFALE